MKCRSCPREIKAGAEEKKRVEHRRQPDDSIKSFGVNMPDGPLEQATGKLVSAEHQKCYWARVKAERRGT